MAHLMSHSCPSCAHQGKVGQMKEEKTIWITLIAVAVLNAIISVAMDKHLTGAMLDISKAVVLFATGIIACVPIYKHILGVSKRKAILVLIQFCAIIAIVSEPRLIRALTDTLNNTVVKMVLSGIGIKDIYIYGKRCLKKLQQGGIDKKDYVCYDDGKKCIEGKLYAYGRDTFRIRSHGRFYKFYMNEFKHVNLSRDRFVLDL